MPALLAAGLRRLYRVGRCGRIRHERDLQRVRLEVHERAIAGIDTGANQAAEDRVAGKSGTAPALHHAVNVSFLRLITLFRDGHDEFALALLPKRAGTDAGLAGRKFYICLARRRFDHEVLVRSTG